MTIQRIGRIGAIPTGLMDVRARTPIGRKPAWWQVAGKTCVAAYQPKVVATLAASYINLANPGTYDAAPGVAPTWASATGWTFNGSTQYLTTGIVPASGWSMLIRYANVEIYDNYLAGSSGGANKEFYLMPYAAANAVLYANGQGWRVAHPSLAAGVVGVAGNKAYRNGADESITMGAWDGITTYQIYIGGYNNSGTPALRPSTVIAVAIYSDTLTAGEVSTVSAAMAAL